MELSRLRATQDAPSSRALVVREHIREKNRQHIQQPVGALLIALGQDMQLDIDLLQAGDVETVMAHLAYYAARLGEIGSQLG